MASRRSDAVSAWLKAAPKRTMALLLRTIAKRWSSKTNGAFPYTPGSFRQMFLRWRDGEADFDAHPALQDLLCAVLERDRFELFPPRAPNEPLIALEGFEVIGPLDLRSERAFDAGCLVRGDGRRKSRQSLVAVDFASDPTWIHAPPGSGRSLAATVHEFGARQPPAPTSSISAFFGAAPGPSVRVLRLGSLQELDRTTLPPPEVPLVVKVDLPGERDEEWATFLSSRRNVRVLAGFPVPRSSGPGAEATASAWAEWRWAPDRDWRSGFVAWVAERLRNRLREGAIARTSFDGDAVIRWLDTVDPGVERYATPGELLPILALAHEHGATHLPARLDAAFARRLLGAQATRASRPDDVRWLESGGSKALEHLLLGAWSDSKSAWPAALPLQEWARWMPVDASAPPTVDLDELRELAPEIAKVRNAKRRDQLLSKHAAIVESLARRRGVHAVRALASARLLRPAADGRYAPGPTWAQELLVIDALRSSLLTADPREWGRLAADAARQPLLDRGLAALKNDDFFAVVEQVVGSFGADDLGLVAAAETLFVACSARLHTAPCESRRVRLLHALWECQRLLLVRSLGGDLAASRTRGGPEDTQGVSAGWWAVCWRWSLSVPAPTPSPPERLAWLFPGWFETLGPPPVALLHDARARAEGESPALDHLFELAARVVARWGDPDKEGQIPDVVLAAAIPIAVERRWSMSALAGPVLRRDDALTERIGRALDRLPSDVRAEVLAQMWDVQLQRSIHAPDDLWPCWDTSKDRERSHPPRLGHLLRDAFPVTAIVARIPHGVWIRDTSMRALVRGTPEAHRAALTRALLAVPDRRSEVVPVLLEEVERHVDVLVEVSALVAPPEARRIAMAIWQHFPDRAESLATDAWIAHGDTEPWLSSVTADHVMRVARIFERHPEREIPDAYLGWIARTLSRRGTEADEVFKLLSRQGWDRLSVR